jgi:hypothetical protein
MLGAQLKPPQTGKFCRRARNRWQGPRAAAGTRLSHKPLIGKSISPGATRLAALLALPA